MARDRVVLASGCLCFAAVAAAVGWGVSRGFDERVLRYLRREGDPATPIGPAWVAPAALALTAMGSSLVVLPAAAACAGWLYRAGRRRAALLVAASTLGGVLLSEVLKRLFDRPRPSLVPHLERVVSPAFPSGHAMLAAAFYFVVAALLARQAARRGTRAGIWAVAAALVALVGASRVVLGVHYPTDVLAGWAAGAAWAAACWMAARPMTNGAKRQAL
jgi:undecaprenyl-diphosphatase